MDINTLEDEGYELINKANDRLQKVKSTVGEVGVIRIFKTWKNLRKADVISTELDLFIPKIAEAEFEVKSWLAILSKKKLSFLLHGDVLTQKLTDFLQRYEKQLDDFDERSNDCRQINFDVGNLSAYLLSGLVFSTVSHFVSICFYGT